MTTLRQIIKDIRKKKFHRIKSPMLRGNPQRKAVCLKVYTTKPKKPNSAIRKIAKVKFLSTGLNTIVYIPGHGHKSQQHSVVLIRGGRVPDLPGVKYHIIRGKYDFTSIETQLRNKRRSKFSIKKNTKWIELNKE